LTVYAMVLCLTSALVKIVCPVLLFLLLLLCGEFRYELASSINTLISFSISFSEKSG